VDSYGRAGKDSSLVQGEDGSLHVSYSEVDGGDIKYASFAAPEVPVLKPSSWLPLMLRSCCPCSPDADQAALFVGRGYTGECVVKGIGDYPTYRDIGLPFDSISSLKMGANVQATLCSDGQFEGRCELFTADDSALEDNEVGDDDVSSVKVEPRAIVD
jgi:hypothetical protein